jgi:hypothetical protein
MPSGYSEATGLSKEGKNPRSLDQALNDATKGQFGEQLRPEVKPDPKRDKK